MKKILLVLVCLAMLAQLCPLSAFADSEQEYFFDVSSFDHFKPRTRAPSFDTDKLKEVLYAGLYDCKSSIDISSFGIANTTDNVDIIANLMYLYIPESFHLRLSYSISTSQSKIMTVNPQYKISKSEYQSMLAQMVAVKEKLVQGIKDNSNLDDVQKALLLHDRLAMVCQYDYSFSEDGSSAYGAMVNGSAVCQGYAEAYYYLMNDVGIKVDYCESTQLNHIWNLVYINNTPYHVDVTWDDIAWGNGERGAIGAVYHDNFLRSSNGIYNTGHDSNDYNKTPNSTIYDNYFWQNSNTAFQLINNELYYINNSSSTLERYSDKMQLCSVSSSWKKYYSYGNHARLSSDGRYLYYSLADAVYQFDVSSNKSKKIFEPVLTNYNYIYGFMYKDGYLICDISDTPPYYSGRSVLYQIREPYSAPSIGSVKEWNVALDGNINLNFYLSVDNNIATTAKVNITVAGETISKNVLELSTVDGLYRVCVELAAAQMNDAVSVQVVNGEESGDIFTYSVRQYCDIVLNDMTLSAYHSLVKEMLNYGAMSQKYFNYNTSNLANNGITETAAKAVPSTADSLIINGKLSDSNFYGASLVYQDRIAVRFYFTGNVTGCTFKVNGVSYSPTVKDGMYYIEIADILPQDLNKQISLIVTSTEGNSLTVTYGPMNYLVRMNQSGNLNTCNLLKALYNYHLAAKSLSDAA